MLKALQAKNKQAYKTNTNQLLSKRGCHPQGNLIPRTAGSRGPGDLVSLGEFIGGPWDLISRPGDVFPGLGDLIGGPGDLFW